MSDLDDNYDEDYRKLRDLIFYISVVIFCDLLNTKDNNNDQLYICPYRDNAARYNRHYNCRRININTSADCYNSIIYEIYNMVYAPHYIALKNKDCATTCLVV